MSLKRTSAGPKTSTLTSIATKNHNETAIFIATKNEKRNVAVI